jgi:hypothetical protein
MKNISRVRVGAMGIAMAVLAAVPATAQEKKVSLYAGYAYFKADDTSLHGVRISPEYRINALVSVAGDFSYEKGKEDGASTSLTTYLGGLRLHRGLGGIGVYVHALAGAAKSEASISPFGGVKVSASDTGFTLDGGGGLEFGFKGSLKLRLGADYIRRKVSFGGASTNVNDIRATAGVAF